MLTMTENKFDFSEDTLKQCVKEMYPRIVVSFEPRGYILDSLFEKDTITIQEKQRIEELSEERAAALVDWLLTCQRPHAMAQFLQTLSNNDRTACEWITESVLKTAKEKVVLALRSSSAYNETLTQREIDAGIESKQSNSRALNKTMLTSAEKKFDFSEDILRQCVKKMYSSIVIGFDPKGIILNSLFAKDMITITEKQRIERLPERRAAALLDLLLTSPRPNAMAQFLKILYFSEDGAYMWIPENVLKAASALAPSSTATISKRDLSAVNERGEHSGSALPDEDAVAPDAPYSADVSSDSVIGQSASPSEDTSTGTPPSSEAGVSTAMHQSGRDAPITTDQPAPSTDASTAEHGTTSASATELPSQKTGEQKPCNVKEALPQTPGSDIEFKELTIGNIIGHGGYGTVYKAQHATFGTVVYKKLEVKFVQDYDAEDLKTEARLQMKLDHPNIVKCLGMVFEPGNYGLIIEHMEHGEIGNFLKRNNNLETKLRVIKDVATGMLYLHSLTPPVIHGDLKIHNVLMGKELRATICDFGFSIWKIYSKSHSVNKVPLGTLTHVPPERLRRNTLRKNETSDVYSFGITVWEIVTLKRPFENADGVQALISEWVKQGDRPDSDIQPSWNELPDKVSALVRRCWDGEARSRPTFEDILKELE